MVKSFLAKKKSKRMTCRRKHKIERKIREHNRKVRKETKEKRKKVGGERRKPEVRVPNKCPFKDDVLREAVEKRQIEENNRAKQREAVKEKRKKLKERKLNEKRNLDSLIQDAIARQGQYDATKFSTNDSSVGSLDFTSSKAAENSVKAYYSEVKKVMEKADVVVEVLDARDPLGSRSEDLEKSVVESGKRLILLLNKIDLIPKDNVLAWLQYLRGEFPAVAFKASTQEQSSNLGRAGHAITSTSKCIGADLLMKLLGNYCRNKDIKTSICVGIVGYPNVGKSSVINSLKRKAACNVGALPGITKTLQQVHLDKKIRLIDSPGVALCSKDGYDRVEMALKNVIRVDLLDDPISPVEAILRRCTKDSLMLQYTIGEFEDIDGFLSQVARKIGRLKKGGVPDRRMAAKKVLHDWNAGKIRYYTVPPENVTGVELISSELVSEMGKEFDIDSIEVDQRLIVDDLPSLPQPNAVVLPAWKDVVKLDGDKMQIDKDSNTVNILIDNKKQPSSSLASSTTSLPRYSKKAEVAGDPQDVLDGNLKRNKSAKLQLKKDKKKRKKADKLATTLSNAFDGAMEIGEDVKLDNYSFDVL